MLSKPEFTWRKVKRPRVILHNIITIKNICIFKYILNKFISIKGKAEFSINS